MAGLHARTVGRKPYSISRQAVKEKGALIDAYHSTSDPLITLQLASVVTRGVVLPHALGVGHAITPAPQWQHPLGDLVKGIPGKDLLARGLDCHGIAPQMVDHIEHEKDQDTATLTNFIAR